MGDEDKDMAKGHRSRLRRKYLAAGWDGLLDYERVELLLTYAISRRDVKPVAKRLVSRFKSLSGIMDAGMKELCEVEGLAENSALLLKMLRDVCGAYLEEGMEARDVMNSPEAVKSFVRMRMSGLKDEAFMVIYLNTKNHVIGTELMGEGTVDHAVIFPRNIVKGALERHSAGVIIVHNHPSGISKPSRDDVQLTDAVKEASETLGIRLVDHLVVAKEDCFSFVDNKLL